MSSFYAIAQSVEDSIVERITDHNTGLAAITTQMAQAVDMDLPTLDLTPDGNQLFRIQVSAADFIATGNPPFPDPAIFVYVMHTEDRHRILGRDFSGSVMGAIDIFLSSENEDLPVYLQKLANLYTDAIYHVFGVGNCIDLQHAGISLNGGLKVVRTMAQRDKAENWFQALNVTLPLYLN